MRQQYIQNDFHPVNNLKVFHSQQGNKKELKTKEVKKLPGQIRINGVIIVVIVSCVAFHSSEFVGPL